MPRGERLIGVIRNPKSQRNRDRGADFPGHTNVILAEPNGRSAIGPELECLAAHGIDYLAIDGGDGTIRDVLTHGASIFGDSWPTLVVIPSGKTNALAVDIGMPRGLSLMQALDAITTGRRIVRHPLKVTPLEGSGGAVLGFILGAGLYTQATRAGQELYQSRALDAAGVAVTTFLAIMRSLAGNDDDKWRALTGMEIDIENQEMPLGGSDLLRRYFMIASTLERWPLGMKPFGKFDSGLRIGVLNRPSRRLMAALPAIVMGYDAPWARRAGLHRAQAKSFTLSIDERFIVDGEAFPAGRYRIAEGPALRFVTR